MHFPFFSPHIRRQRPAAYGVSVLFSLLLLEKALEPYPIVIPETAEFKVGEDGWCSFTCDRYIDGAMMIDGTLRNHSEERIAC